MCYIQVSEHLRGQAAGASMRQGRISSVFQEYNKTFMFSFLQMKCVKCIKIRINCVSKLWCCVTDDVILCLWTERLDIISTGGGRGGVNKSYNSPIQIEKYNQNQIGFFFFVYKNSEINMIFTKKQRHIQNKVTVFNIENRTSQKNKKQHESSVTGDDIQTCSRHEN